MESLASIVFYLHAHSYLLPVVARGRRPEAKAQLSEMGFHDPLTGIGNRRLFLEFAENRIKNAARNRHKLGLLLIDIDKFKPINGNHGHDVGDEILKEIGQRLQGISRQGDVVARLGGDEFVALISAVASHKFVRSMANGIQKRLCEPMLVSDQTFNIKYSFGIALLPDDGKNISEILKYADQQMYQAKFAVEPAWNSEKFTFDPSGPGFFNQQSGLA